jgi:lactoylglutathione lyase
MIKRFDGVSLWSSDLNRLLPFYRDVMGLPVALESPRFVILGDFENPRLCLGSHSEVHGPASDPYRWLVRLESDDIDADVARLRAQGVEIVEEPNDQGGGFWLATCKDPEGNLVQLNYWAPGSQRSP